MTLFATDRGPVDGFIACSAMSSALNHSSPPTKGQEAALQGIFVDANKSAFGNYVELKDCTLVQP
jgi:hypothetical protein